MISTDRGAIIESVKDGKNGYIVEAKNPEQIAEKLELLVKDSTVRERMGKTSRQYYEERFTEEIMVENLSGIFEHVMAA